MVYLPVFIKKRILIFLQLLLLVSMSFTSTFVFAQSDSVDEKNHEKAIYYASRNRDSLFFYSKQLQKSKGLCRRLTGKSYEAKYYYIVGDYDKSENLIKEIFVEIDASRGQQAYIQSKRLVGLTHKECLEILKMNLRRRLFYIYNWQQKYDQAYLELILREDIIDSLKEKNSYYLRNKISVGRSRAHLQRNMGGIRSSLKILKDMKGLLQGFKIDSSNVWYENFQREKSYIYTEIASNYTHLFSENGNISLIDSIKFYNNLSLSSSRQKGNGKDNLLPYNLMKCWLFYAEEKLDSLHFLINETSKLYSSENKRKTGVKYFKTLYFRKVGLLDSSNIYGKRWLSFEKEIEYNQNSKINIVRALSENYNELNKFDSAYYYNELLTDLLYKKSKASVKALNLMGDDVVNKSSIREDYLITRKIIAEKKIFIVISLSIIIILGIIFYNWFKRRKIISKLKNKYSIQNLPESSNFEVSSNLKLKIIEGLTLLESREIYLEKGFNMSVAANLLNTNTSYLSKIINSEKHMTFNKYIRQLRIQYAMKIISTNDKYSKYTIKALGESVGYKGASSFAKAFKEVTGQNPSKYIKEIKKR